MKFVSITLNLNLTINFFNKKYEEIYVYLLAKYIPQVYPID